MHTSKPQNNNWLYLGHNSNNLKIYIESSSNITNKNAYPWRTSNDQKTGCRYSNHYFTIEDKSDEKLMNEFEIMKMLDHPNAFKAVAIIYNDTKTPSILYEKMSNWFKLSSLNQNFSEAYLAYSIFQITEGMKYIQKWNTVIIIKKK